MVLAVGYAFNSIPARVGVSSGSSGVNPENFFRVTTFWPVKKIFARDIRSLSIKLAGRV